MVYRDPLIKKFKKGVFKHMDASLRFNEFVVLRTFHEILDKHKSILPYIKYWLDFDDKIGIHVNILFYSSSYKTLLDLYNNDNPKKVKHLFWYMKDLLDTQQTVDFVTYAYMREQTNWRYYKAANPPDSWCPEWEPTSPTSPEFLSPLQDYTF